MSFIFALLAFFGAAVNQQEAAGKVSTQDFHFTQSAGKVSMNDFHFVMRNNSSSPK